MAPSNTATVASQSGAFTCFNVNCYAMFKTERGLRQHLWRSAPCQEYMSVPRPLAASLGIVHESTWRRRLGYGIESSRLNPFMSAVPPSYEPYEVFDYSANFDNVNFQNDMVIRVVKSPWRHWIGHCGALRLVSH